MARGLEASGTGGSVRSTLSAYRYGNGDLTTRLAATEFWRASHTPTGPATLRISWSSGSVDADGWGPGRQWMLDQVAALTGQGDAGHQFTLGHPAVLRAQRNHPNVRFGASHMLYHELLPTILGQRITAGEAIRQWHQLCRRLGDPAPGPEQGLMLPPDPARLAAQPAWSMHPMGIEARRAEALRSVAKHAAKLWDWTALRPADVAVKLALLPGIGAWTIGSVLATAQGDSDAVAVGDYHLKNLVSYALAGEPRGTDERMLELLEPYIGQRGRVVRLLQFDGHSPPAFGPRHRILPMARW
jgi:endonuclease III